MKKIICFGLAFLSALLLLAGCGNGTTPGGTTNTTDPTDSGNTVTQPFTDPTDEPDPAAPVVGFPLLKNGVPATIRYSVMASGTEFSVVADGTATLSRRLGVTVTREDDFNRDADAAEILIGDTSYPETATAKNALSYSEGAIRVVGNKLVIVATSADELKTTFSRFVELLTSFKQTNGDYIVPEGSVTVVNSIETLKELPVLPGREPTIIDGGDNCYQLHFANSTEADYKQYVNVFKQHDYRLTAKNDLEGNLFSTLVNSEKIVNLIWTPNTKDLRVLVDPRSYASLPNSADDNIYDQSLSVTPTITQVGLYLGGSVTGSGMNSGVTCEGKQYATGYNAGMSYVIRLADGSFIIVDGGYETNEHRLNLYNVLKKQAPDPDHIVIAAWIFTHAHNDHVGVVPLFLSAYLKTVAVEKFIFNFPNSSRDITGAIAVRNILKNVVFQNSKIIKAHAGQVDYIRNAKVTMLYTLENMEKWDLSYYNDCSLVFSVEIGGQTLLFTGDCPDTLNSHEGTYIRKIYGTGTLKADILQLNHHGTNDNNVVRMWEQPTWAFVPSASWQVAIPQSDGSTVYCNNDARKYNAAMVNMPEDHVLLAGSGVQILSISNGTVTAQTWDTVAGYLES